MKKILLLILLVFGVALAQAADSAQANSWFDKLWSDPIATFTGILAVATIGLIVVSAVQWVQMKRAVDSSEDTAKKELRAYVALNNVEFLVIGSQLSNHLMIRVQNYGQTPSFNTSIRCGSDTTKPATFTVRDHPGVGKQMLHPGMAYSVEITEERSPTYRGEKAQGWVWGQLIYQDIYEQWWRTNFFYLHHVENKFTPESEYNNEQGPYTSEAKAFEG